MGIAGLVFGILSLVFCWVAYFGLIIGILGIIFSAIGIKEKINTGCSVGGLVTSILGVIYGMGTTVFVSIFTSIFR